MAGVEIGEVIKKAQGRYDRMPLVGGIFRDWDRSVQDVGFQKATSELVKRAGCSPKIEFGKDAERVLINEPVLLIADHPHVVESVLLVASLPLRENMSVIAGLDYMTFGSNIARFLIPVASDGSTQDKDLNFWAKVVRKLRFAPKFSLTPLEKQRESVKSFKKFSELIKGGGLVVLFPDGGKGETSKWFPGIINRLKRITKDSNPYLVWGHVDGVSNIDLLRAVRSFGEILPPMRVTATFSEPQKLSEFVAKESDPRMLDSFFQAEYYKWVYQLHQGGAD